MADILRYDLDTVKEDGSDNLTLSIMEIVNQFPLLGTKTIEFQKLDITSGIALFPNPTVAIMSEKVSITGHTSQKCAYAFTIVYRTRTSGSKENVKEWLDDLGRWLERQDVKGYKLLKYPTLADGMEFTKISRQGQAYLYDTTDDKAEDWAIPITALYNNEFDV